MKIKSNFDKFRLPVLLLCILLLPMAFGSLVGYEIKSIFYALSLSMKNCLVFILPFIIFSFLSYSLMSLGASAVVFVGLLLFMVTASNFIAILTGFSIGSTFIPLIHISMPAPIADEYMLKPAFEVVIPRVLSNEPAILAGVVIGLFMAFKPVASLRKAIRLLNTVSINFLRMVFLPLLPLFILGFVFKLEHDKMLSQLLNVYGPILILVVCSQIFYVTIFYCIANGFSPKRVLNSLRNTIPATITGFSTISSAATMPVTILCAEKNLNNINMARTIIPATANIHTVGSALGLTILCLATLQAFHGQVPNFFEFFEFAMYYTMAKYAVAGIPGGVVIVVSPLLEAYLGFTPEMVGLITAVYLLFDPFGTATNVTCNGAFAMIFNKVYRKISKDVGDEFELPQQQTNR